MCLELIFLKSRKSELEKQCGAVFINVELQRADWLFFLNLHHAAKSGWIFEGIAESE